MTLASACAYKRLKQQQRGEERVTRQYFILDEIPPDVGGYFLSFSTINRSVLTEIDSK